MKTSRTAVVTYQQCPRKRYLQFHYAGTGVEPRRQSIPLVWGSGIHKGVEGLLKGLSPDDAVSAALSEYEQQCTDREFDIDDLESQSFVFNEGRALIEGFTRAWDMERKTEFLGTYEVLEVEQEGLWTGWTDGIDFAYRPDALLRHRNTGGLYVFNLKSSYAWGEREQKASRYNVQGLSEMAAIEQRLNVKLAGIQDEIFIKGSRQSNKDETKYQATYLVHPWLKQGITADDDEWAWKYYFEKNGKGSRLGNAFSRVNVWEHTTMKEWITLLGSGQLQSECGNPLTELFATPIPHHRNDQELSEWLAQARAQEMRIVNGLAEVDSSPAKLDEHFPMYRHSCFNYQRVCEFAPICHDRLSPDCGIYVERADHHAEINSEN